MRRTAPEHQVVLLTGASSGIGWASALEFAKRDCSLALVARRRGRLRELAGLLKVPSLVCPSDVRDLARARRLVSQVLRAWGRIDILVNDAGIIVPGSFHEQTLEAIEDQMRTNFLGAAALTRAVLPAMLRQGSGHILNVSSIAGLKGFPRMAPYCASKFALIGMTEALAAEYADTGVSVCALCPGPVRTPMSAPALERGSPALTAEAVAARLVECCMRRVKGVVRMT